MRTSDPSGTSERIWFLHSLRAFAVLGVLYSHVVSGPWAQAKVHAAYVNVPTPDLTTLDSKWDNPLLVPSVWGPFSWPYHHGVDTGAAGVGLFFLISGTLIPFALERRRPGSFLITRCFRIYPVWLASLAIAGLWFVGYSAMTDHPGPPYGAAAWGANAGLITDWVPLWPVINPVIWTLLIEWKFYLLCAGLAALGLLHRPTAIAATVAALTAVGFAGNRYLDGRAFTGEFLEVLANMARDSAPFLCMTFIGVCMYHRLTERWSARRCGLMIGTLSGLMVIAFRFGTPDWDAGWVRIRSFVAAGVVFAILYVLRERIPRSQFLNWIADISYPMYAVHYLLGVGVMYAVFAAVPIPLAAQLVSVAVTLAVSTAVHRWVERPANSFGKGLSPAQLHVSTASREPDAVG